MIKKALLFNLFISSCLLIAGCSTATPIPTATPTPTPMPSSIAETAGAKMLSVKSMHFVMELQGQPVYLDASETMVFKRAEGDIVQPDSVRAVVDTTAYGMATQVGIIGIGKKQFITNPINQQWEKVPPDQGWFFDPSLLFDPQVGIDAILKQADWSYGAPEEIDGQVHQVLQASLPAELISPLASGMIDSGQVAVDIWVGQQDSYVRRIRMVETGSDPADPTQWLLLFSALNQVEPIKAPPVK